MTNQQCQCTVPTGEVKIFCQRHQCTKYKRLVELCNLGAQGEPFARDYWRAWEEGRGPRQVEHEPKEREQNPRSGVGTESAKIFASIKVPLCASCNDKSREWDKWGVERCRENRAELVTWLVSQAKDKNVSLVDAAIELAKEEPLLAARIAAAKIAHPLTDTAELAAGLIVDLAIARAESATLASSGPG